MADGMALMKLLDSSGSGERQRRIERQKLNALLGYCEAAGWRRQVLLGYFGERDHPRCGNCDNCLAPVSVWNGVIAAQKALSAVFRTGQRFGVPHLVDVLLGKMSQRIRQLGHDPLKTFGVGAELEKHESPAALRHLVPPPHLPLPL